MVAVAQRLAAVVMPLTLSFSAHIVPAPNATAKSKLRSVSKVSVVSITGDYA